MCCHSDPTRILCCTLSWLKILYCLFDSLIMKTIIIFFVLWVHSSDGSQSKIFDPGRVGSAIIGLGLNLENFP